MRKLTIIALALATTFALAAGPSTLEEAQKMSAETGKPVLVDFFWQN